MALVNLTLEIDDEDIVILERHARQEFYPCMTDLLSFLLRAAINAETFSERGWEVPVFNPDDCDDEISF